MLLTELERKQLVALRVIYTWATFDLEHNDGQAVVCTPDAVAAIVGRAIGKIEDKREGEKE